MGEKVFNKEPFCKFFTCNCDGSDTFADWGGTGKSRRQQTNYYALQKFYKLGGCLYENSRRK